MRTTTWARWWFAGAVAMAAQLAWVAPVFAAEDEDKDKADDDDDDDDDEISDIGPDVGAGIGVDIPTSGLGVGPGFFIEGGAHFKLGPGVLAPMLRIGFEYFPGAYEGSRPCPSADSCMAPNGGAYEYDLDEQVLRFGIPVSYRLFPENIVSPYLGIGPFLFLVKSTSTVMESENTETSTEFGLTAFLGGLLRVGPGGIFLEAGYQYAGLAHRMTGDTDLGAVVTAAGYRLVL